VFIADLQTSALCDERQYEHLDGDAFAKLYNDTIAGLHDKQIPVRQVTCRRRPSIMWFDDECHRANGKGQWKGLLVAPVRCLTTTCWLLRRGASRDVSTSPCYNRNVPTTGRNVWTLSSHDRIDFGNCSMSCLVAAEHLCHQTLMLLHCIASSTTRSLPFVHPPMALIHRSS